MLRELETIIDSELIASIRLGSRTIKSRLGLNSRRCEKAANLGSSRTPATSTNAVARGRYETIHYTN